MGVRRRLVKRVLEMNIDVSALGQWDFDIDNVEPMGKVFLLSTDLGIKCLKIINKPVSKVYQLFLVMEHLVQQDLRNVPRFIRTKFGEPYVKTSNSCYCISDWIFGGPINFKDLNNVAVAAKQLARIHRASNGFLLPGEDPKRLVYFNWQQQFQDIALKMIEIKSKISNDTILKKSLQAMINRAVIACKMLKEAGYKELKLQFQNGAGFCHGAYDEHHIIITDSGKIHILGFDEWVRDIRLKDVVRFAYNVGAANNWNSENICHVIKNYDMVYPLYPAELEIIQAYICFPFEYWELLKIIAKTNFDNIVLEERIEKCFEHDEKKQQCLTALTQWTERSC